MTETLTQLFDFFHYTTVPFLYLLFLLIDYLEAVLTVIFIHRIQIFWSKESNFNIKKSPCHYRSYRFVLFCFVSVKIAIIVLHFAFIVRQCLKQHAHHVRVPFKPYFIVFFWFFAFLVGLLIYGSHSSFQNTAHVYHCACVDKFPARFAGLKRLHVNSKIVYNNIGNGLARFAGLARLTGLARSM